jgi:hypothetical protein
MTKPNELQQLNEFPSAKNLREARKLLAEMMKDETICTCNADGNDGIYQCYGHDLMALLEPSKAHEDSEVNNEDE